MARASLWVVTRYAPRAAGWSDEPEFYASQGGEPAGVPLCGFANKKDAEAARKQLERAARETTPPGLFLRSLVPEGLADIVKAAKRAKLPPPDLSAVGPPVGPTRTGLVGLSYGKDYSEYCDRVERAVREWWASVAPEISPEANARLWDDLFPDFQFFTLNRVLFEG
jgi:hypothetical protein